MKQLHLFNNLFPQSRKSRIKICEQLIYGIKTYKPQGCVDELLETPYSHIPLDQMTDEELKEHHKILYHNYHGPIDTIVEGNQFYFIDVVKNEELSSRLEQLNKYGYYDVITTTCPNDTTLIKFR